MTKVNKKGTRTTPYFFGFGLNTEKYFVSLGIQSECGKISRRSGVYIVNIKHFLHFVLVFLLLTLTCNCRLVNMLRDH